MHKILTINTGSTSTKIAVFEDEKKTLQENIEHSEEDLAGFADIPAQLPFRRETVENTLRNSGYDIRSFDAIVGRGGSLLPCEGGTYEVQGLLLEHARNMESGPHPAALGTVIAYEFAKDTGARAFTVDPPDVDELEPIAKISGIKSAPRRSSAHVLNQKEVARRAAKEIGTRYEDSSFIVAHVGGGVSVGAHKCGRIIDATSLISGEGPMAPTRCGTLPVLHVVKLLEDGVSPERMREYVLKDGGIIDHLGTSDMREVQRRIAEGDEYARLVRDAQIYHIAKSIGSLATVLEGKIDAIVLTGGLMNSKDMDAGLRARVDFLAKVLTYPGEFEQEALANGALRVLRGEEELKVYKPM